MDFNNISYMAQTVTMAGEEKSTKKKRDPIFSVCFVIFVVAAVAVLGSFINSEYIQEDTTKVAYGDKVVVNYTGSYYDYYDNENAVIFDTSFRSIGESADYKKANDFSKSSYSTFDVTVGSKKALELFELSLVGHKVGDEVRVMIPAGQGYNAEPRIGDLSDCSINLKQTYTATQFKNLYPDVKLNNSTPVEFTTVYGWKALATTDNVDVIVTNNSTTFEGEYKYGGEDTGLLVKGATYDSANETIDFKFELDTAKVHKVGGPVENIQTIQMIKVNLNGVDTYLTSYNTNTGVIQYKQTAENSNISLFFVIKIVSIGS